jgi:hypothetical protein
VSILLQQIITQQRVLNNYYQSWQISKRLEKDLARILADRQPLTSSLEIVLKQFKPDDPKLSFNSGTSFAIVILSDNIMPRYRLCASIYQYENLVTGAKEKPSLLAWHFKKG